MLSAMHGHRDYNLKVSIYKQTVNTVHVSEVFCLLACLTSFNSRFCTRQRTFLFLKGLCYWHSLTRFIAHGWPGEVYGVEGDDRGLQEARTRLMFLWNQKENNTTGIERADFLKIQCTSLEPTELLLTESLMVFDSSKMISNLSLKVSSKKNQGKGTMYYWFSRYFTTLEIPEYHTEVLIY